MNAAEALMIVEFVQQACPAQKFSEYTPDVWSELLADLDFADSKAACVALGKTHTFIGPPEIRTEVRRIRSKRLEVDCEDIPALDAVANDPIAYLRVLREHRAKVAAGWVPPAIEKPRARAVAELVRTTAEAMPRIPRMSLGGDR